MLKFMWISIFYKKRLGQAAKLLEKDYKRLVKKEGKWGAVVCSMSAEKSSTKKNFCMLTNDNLKYTSLPSIIVVKNLLRNKLNSGVNYLCDAIECDSFIREISEYGINYTCDEI